MPNKPKTSVDILESHLGALTKEVVDTIEAETLDALATDLNSYFTEWKASPEEDLPLYSGGWIAGNLEVVEARQYLLNTLLYYPRVIMHDPLAEWFYPFRDGLVSPPPVVGKNSQMIIRGSEPALLAGNGYFVFRSQPERTRLFLRSVLPMLKLLKPAIDQGVILLVPQWWLVRERQTSILSAVRHDVRNSDFVDVLRTSGDAPVPRTDHIRGMAVTPHGGWKAGEEYRGESQEASYFLNKTLAISDAVGALYIPPATNDARLLAVRLDSAAKELRAKDIELKVAPALMAAQLPWVGNLDADVILAIRKDSDSFADWRAELRTLLRSVSSSREDGTAFDTEARAVMQDGLLPRLHSIQNEMSKSAVLKSHLKDGVLELGLGTGSLVAVASAGAPVTAVAVAALGVSAATRWLLSPFFRSKTGSKSVLATLAKKTQS